MRARRSCLCSRLALWGAGERTLRRLVGLWVLRRCPILLSQSVVIRRHGCSSGGAQATSAFARSTCERPPSRRRGLDCRDVDGGQVAVTGDAGPLCTGPVGSTGRRRSRPLRLRIKPGHDGTSSSTSGGSGWVSCARRSSWGWQIWRGMWSDGGYRGAMSNRRGGRFSVPDPSVLSQRLL